MKESTRLSDDDEVFVTVKVFRMIMGGGTSSFFVSTTLQSTVYQSLLTRVEILDAIDLFPAHSSIILFCRLQKVVYEDEKRPTFDSPQSHILFLRKKELVRECI